jgi:hypothetical protein
MYYEINISKNGMHFFATAERSITSYKELQKVYSVIQEKFPKSEGYELSVKEYQVIGKHVELSL